MTDTPHANLTGADLHEPKGAATATANKVYVANGSGSGTWKKITSSELDTTSIFNANKIYITFFFDDIGIAKTVYLHVPTTATLNNIQVVLEAANTTTSTVLTFKNTAGTAMANGSLTFGAAAVAGTNFSTVPTTNNTFTAGTLLQITSDGGSTTVTPASVTLTFTQTA